MFDGERTIKADFEQADFFAMFGKVVDGLFDCFAARAHHYDNVLRIGRAVVLEQLVLSARQLFDLVHHALNYLGRGGVVFVGGFAVLEVDIRVLRRAFLVRVVGVERARFELAYLLHAARLFRELFDLVVFDAVDLVYLVACPEPVEEVQERDLGFERGEVSDEREIHRFLDGVAREHRKTGLAARHDVRMIAENVERVRGERACAYMEYRGKQLARYLVHIGYHEQQALARRICSGERACDERAVDSARSAALGLHFRNAKLLPEHVFTSGSSPFVGIFRHRGRRRYGIYRRDFRKSVRDMRRRGIAVDCHLYHRNLQEYKLAYLLYS